MANEPNSLRGIDVAAHSKGVVSWLKNKILDQRVAKVRAISREIHGHISHFEADDRGIRDRDCADQSCPVWLRGNLDVRIGNVKASELVQP